MSESCNSRHFSRLVKSCFPNPHETKAPSQIHHSNHREQHHSSVTSISSLPDDLLLECLSRVPTSTVPALPLVCRRWAHILASPSFVELRRRGGHLRDAVFAVSATDAGLFTAVLRAGDSSWKLALFLPDDAAPLIGLFAHARLAALGPRIYIISRGGTARYDAWTGQLAPRSPMLSPRRKFAAAAFAGKIYVAGGGGRGEAAAAVEEYDPDADAWRAVARSPRCRYGCIGAAVDGVFYVIGGLRIGGGGGGGGSAAGAHVYAGSMDLYDVEDRRWLRSRAVPGGGCVVAACAAGGHLYVLASHAVELSFWSFDARRRGGGFGEWCRLKSPPLPARVDGAVRFSCVGAGGRVVLVQVTGCIDDLLRRSGRSARGMREGLVLVYDTAAGEWSRTADLPGVLRRAACVGVEC